MVPGGGGEDPNTFLKLLRWAVEIGWDLGEIAGAVIAACLAYIAGLMAVLKLKARMIVPSRQRQTAEERNAAFRAQLREDHRAALEPIMKTQDFIVDQIGSLEKSVAKLIEADHSIDKRLTIIEATLGLEIRGDD